MFAARKARVSARAWGGWNHTRSRSSRQPLLVSSLLFAGWAMVAAAIALSRSQAIEAGSQGQLTPSTSDAARLAGVGGKRN